jgi:hypothetical protein
MKLDWNKIEEKLDLENAIYKATEESISEFVKLNSTNEIFYAFAFDYGLTHSHFGLCFNTIEHFNDLISDYEKIDNNKIFELKYNTGNWKYQFFNSETFPSVKKIWDLTVGEKLIQLYEIFESFLYNESISEETSMETLDDLEKNYKNTINNVILRIKKNDFKGMKRVNDFKIYHIDFDDNLLEIKDRIMK